MPSKKPTAKKKARLIRKSKRLKDRSDKLFKEKMPKQQKKHTKRVEKGKDDKRISKKRSRTQDREQKLFIESYKAEAASRGD